jgi:hypothetical protein
MEPILPGRSDTTSLITRYCCILQNARHDSESRAAAYFAITLLLIFDDAD